MRIVGSDEGFECDGYTGGMNEAIKVLKQYFGYDAFRPLQAEIVATVMSGKHCLALMPTGGGKSVCYQIPALLLPGVALVVSPLISLMKDQVEGLRQAGVEAAFLNSSLSTEESKHVLSELKRGKIKLLYVAPERLVMSEFLAFFKTLRVSLMAVDEAHCISTWGHSFRKDYTELKKLREVFPEVPVIGLTATADALTRRDILEQLLVPDAEVFMTSFDRPNIKLSVLPAVNRMRLIVELVLDRTDQAGIVYCLSRKSAERMAKKLVEAGVGAAYYHASMDAGARARVQEDFLRDELQVICATVAFGMGIDKSNVRYVIHHNLPPNVESYYQEIGRAGRDGLPSEAILFYSSADVMQRRRMILGDNLNALQQQTMLGKLQAMQRWAELMTCRRQFILQYFDEAAPVCCANCDVCLEPGETFDGTEVAQKVLSVLARVGKPVSAFTMVNILRGSKARYILDGGFDRIKTYGVGANMSAPAWRQYIEQLLALGLIDAIRRGEGLVITAEGKKVLLGKRAVKLKKSALESGGLGRRATMKVDDTGYDVVLFEALRKLRKRLADEQNVPAYHVFSDATLRQMAVIKPQAKEGMLGVSGVGMVKWERYGEVFLQVVKDYS
jgi:ATP-dependent DNA helicase RecQ